MQPQESYGNAAEAYAQQPAYEQPKLIVHTNERALEGTPVEPARITIETLIASGDFERLLSPEDAAFFYAPTKAEQRIERRLAKLRKERMKE